MTLTLDQRFARTHAFVEATSYEQQCLWAQRRQPWVQVNHGTSVQIGTFGDMPLVASFCWATVGGKLICFYDQVSMVTHSKLMEQWLRQFGKPIVNAMNFGSIL